MTTLRAAIEADARHEWVATLEAGTADTRQFAGWSLAYAGSATFVDLELQRIDAQREQDAASAARNLKLMLAEFSRTDGVKGF